MIVVYWLDISVILAFWALFLQSLFSKKHIFQQTRSYRNKASTMAPSMWSLSFVVRFLNPFWTTRGIKYYRDISYATQDEREEGATMRKYWKLDVMHHRSFPTNRPVLLYIHSGKKETIPFLRHLALKQYVIIEMDYRHVSQWPEADQLIDVKRAIRWIKENVVTFGGDPSFIAIGGSSNGAYLASLASLTPNEAKFQPGFENLDTSVQCCIAINGFYDLTKLKRFSFEHLGGETSKASAQNLSDAIRDASPYCKITAIQQMQNSSNRDNEKTKNLSEEMNTQKDLKEALTTARGVDKICIPPFMVPFLLF